MSLFKRIGRLFKRTPKPIEIKNDIATLKGNLGEAIVAKVLGKSKPNYNYYVFNNFCFNNGDRTVQIDHLVLDRYGIHVFETKNYTGVITGGEFDTEWYQKINKYEGTFYNPIKQNLGHILALKNQLKINIYCFSYVVFSGNSVLHVNTTTPVITPNEIKSTMNKNTVNRLPLSDASLIKIYNKLVKINTITLEEHLKNVKKRKQHCKS